MSGCPEFSQGEQGRFSAFLKENGFSPQKEGRMTPAFDGWLLVNGPSREMLFDALRLVQEERMLKFEYVLPDDVRREIGLKILAIEAIGDYNAPGGGQMWLVKAFDLDSEMEAPDRICLLNYSTQSRTGTIRFGSADMAGPSYLPADERMREGFFLVITNFGGWQFCIGSFEESEGRKTFLQDLMGKIRDVGFDSQGQDGNTFYSGVAGEAWMFEIALCNAIPEWMRPLEPKDFTGLDMLGDFPSPDEDDPESGDPEM
ncbi:MAG: hypothetical protein A3D44_00665 [Candidatus Staskawiczbacteria bacterium RIFCSPHIGHO2_02_FULL_42_22]|uniref:Uncharacterized protein n=1 Tax=Candidatus Staskawiczbacteria bacterium RIFCSPHIGHO2_02_FULL_42_22 TaxID=1802207 RepID=A0A1G2I1Y3_9BACT|nr:MAG: hypothetical protein A3D44_00665 [Candidatus Staskawiczbacteria bacterium RIFCSPHIGHO2_02_FULL_42_22]